MKGQVNWCSRADCASDETLTSVDYSQYMQQTYGYPFMVCSVL